MRTSTQALKQYIESDSDPECTLEDLSLEPCLTATNEEANLPLTLYL